MKRSMCIKSLQGKVIYGDPAGKRSLDRDMAAVYENTLLPDASFSHSWSNRKVLVAF